MSNKWHDHTSTTARRAGRAQRSVKAVAAVASLIGALLGGTATTVVAVELDDFSCVEYDD